MYVFATLGVKLKALQAQGLDIIRLDMGSPDGPPADFILDAMSRSLRKPSHHGYPGFSGTPTLRRAMVDYYATRFGVELNVADEILPLIGSKEGIANMALAWLDAGDLVLIPDPGYPPYRMSAAMVGAEVFYVPLLEERGYLPDLDAILPEAARRARLLWLNYPNNPTGATASPDFFERAVAFCRRHDILLCHDVPYADVCYDGYRAPSLLAVPGAKDVAVEFNSLSKSHNMAGWRIGMAAGNPGVLAALAQIKTNMDSGIFWPIQDAAEAALTGDQSWLAGRNAEYGRRRDLLHAAFTEGLGLRVAKPTAGLYLWPHVPEGYTSAQFVEKVLLTTGISLTSGAEFGPHGEGYVRVSLGQASARVAEAAERLRKLKL